MHVISNNGVFMKRFLAITVFCISATTAVAQTSDSRPTLWDFFTVERFATAFFNQLITYARAGADVRFESVQVDPVAGLIRVTGLEVSPKIQGIDPDACTITATRTTLDFSPFDQINSARFRVALDDVVAGFDCLPREARPVLGFLGLSDLNIDRADIGVDYDVPSGGAQVQLQAGVDGLVTVLLDADVDYVSYRYDFEVEDVDPSVDLNAARLQIEDQGLSARLEQVLPPEMRDPVTLSDQLGAELANALRDANGETPLNPEQERFIAEAQEMARLVAAGAGKIVVETDIAAQPARLNEATGDNPAALFALLAPRVAPATKAIGQTITRADLIAARDASVSASDQRRIGEALLSGVGAPRNIELGLTLLAPLAEEGDAGAALLMAEVLFERDIEASYTLASQAAAGGQAAALAVLDRAEDTLRFPTLMTLQNEAADADLAAPDRFATLAEMRRAALDHLTGLDAIRSYELAYFWASMAAAGGDTAAARLRDEIDERMRLRGLSDEWAETTEDIEALVLEGWIAADIPNILKTNAQ